MCTCRMDFFDTPDVQINKFDWAQMASLFFQSSGDDRMCTCFPKSSNLNHKSKITFNQYNSEERDEWKKFATSDQDSGITGFKAEGYQARP